MPSYISHDFCEFGRLRKFSFYLFTLWLGIILSIALSLMSSGASGIVSPLDVSREYQRSLDEFLKSRSLPQHKTDKRYTPYWAAQIYGGEVAARSLAIKYGFTYLGEVSCFCNYASCCAAILLVFACHLCFIYNTGSELLRYVYIIPHYYQMSRHHAMHSRI